MADFTTNAPDETRAGVPSPWKRFLALLRQRCPRCLRGPAFSGSLTMHEHCPACGFRFERERGYFIGSMYISYALSMVLILSFMLAIFVLWPALDLGGDVLFAAALFVPLMPVTWRYSRV